MPPSSTHTLPNACPPAASLLQPPCPPRPAAGSAYDITLLNANSASPVSLLQPSCSPRTAAGSAYDITAHHANIGVPCLPLQPPCPPRPVAPSSRFSIAQMIFSLNQHPPPRPPPCRLPRSRAVNAPRLLPPPQGHHAGRRLGHGGRPSRAPRAAPGAALHGPGHRLGADAAQPHRDELPAAHRWGWGDLV